MTDQNMLNFNQRVARINKAHVSGFGFEAEGTLGRSHYTRRQGIRIPLMGPVLVLMSVIVLLKSLIHVRLGGDLYQAKVDLLWGGDVLDHIGAVLMQPDPLTIWLSQEIGRLL